MSDKKISQLTTATLPLAGTEVLPIVQGGQTRQVANNDLRPKQIQSNTTSGVLQIAGPAAASARVMTTPDANFTAARTDAAQTFVGKQTLQNTLSSATSNSTFAELTADFGSGTGNNFGSNIIWINRTTGNFLLEVARIASVGTTADNGAGLSFWTRTGFASYEERMQITYQGNVKVNTGNLVIGTAGKGIDFSADGQAAGMTSELLDDYEEGTWTPSLGGDTTYTVRSGTYTKIGNTVFVRCTILVSSIGTGATSIISGLPYSSGASTVSGLTVGYFSTILNATTWLGARTLSSGTVIYMTGQTSIGVSINDSFATFKNSTYVELSGTYTV